MNKTKVGFTTSVRLLAGFAAFLGCKHDDGDAEEDAVVACAAAVSQGACEAIGGPNYQCGWVKTLSVESEAPCETKETLTCVPYAKGAFTPGCSPIPGCLDSDVSQPGMLLRPAYREDESGTQLVDECGSDAVGFAPCHSGAAEDAAVMACACACALAP